MNITAEIKIIKAMLEGVKDPSILTAIKELLAKAKAKKATKAKANRFERFAGIWSDEDARKIKATIEENCENIEGDW